MDSDGEEGITGMIKKPPIKYDRPARYTSKYRESVKRALNRQKSAHKTFGIPNVSINGPTDFLRKNTGIHVKRTDVKHKHYHVPGYQHKLPAWEPIKSKKPPENSENTENPEKKPEKPPRDFKKTNVSNVVKSQPSNPRMFYVDDRRGSSFPLLPSGLYPYYKNQKYRETEKNESRPGKKDAKKKSDNNFDPERKRPQTSAKSENNALKSPKKTPSSAKSDETDPKPEKKAPSSGNSKKTDMKRQNKSPARPKSKQPMCRYVTEEERAELLLGMKKKWDEMMHKFQCLPFLTDTPPKAKRKSKMEADLKQLEKDIDTIESHPYIYVYSDDENVN